LYNNAYGYYAIIYVCVCIYNIFDSLLFIMYAGPV